jgi:hypothetical protein
VIDKTEHLIGSLEKIVAFEPTNYESFDLNRLSSFTLDWLQKNRIPTTFENIVVAAFRMFPAKFALEGYSEYPDAARVNRALLQLGPKYRNWARGSVQKGFLLTESGLKEVERVREALSGAGSPGPVKTRRAVKPRTMDLSGDMQSIEHSSLFAKWSAGLLAEGTILELLHMLNAYAYTPPRALRDRLASLENAATQIGRRDLLKFLEAVRAKFAQQLTQEGGN